jgi:hypothetical protein
MSIKYSPITGREPFDSLFRDPSRHSSQQVDNFFNGVRVALVLVDNAITQKSHGRAIL